MSETLNSNAPEHDYEQDLNLAEQKAVDLNKLSRAAGTTKHIDIGADRTTTDGITTVRGSGALSGEIPEAFERAQVFIPAGKGAKPGFRGTRYVLSKDRVSSNSNGLNATPIVTDDYKGKAEKRYYLTNEKIEVDGNRLGAAVIRKAIGRALPEVTEAAEEKKNQLSEGLDKFKNR
jgi:hypothetical protein